MSAEESDDAARRKALLRLREATSLHERGDIDGALAAANLAIAVAPSLVEAHLYVGTTLVARKRRFRDGLRALERARELSPQDASVYYNLGWCYEFAAHNLSRRPGRKGSPEMEPNRLYAKAVEYMRRCLELNPDEEMRGDLEKLLERTPGGDA